jgi:hypothetical protein
VPTFFPCRIKVSKGEYDNGDHYDAAAERASNKGYENIGLVYDENDGPAVLFAHYFQT